MHRYVELLKIIKEEVSGIPCDKNFILQMAVKVVNDSAEPDGIVPTLLVFGVFPRMIKDSTIPRNFITGRGNKKGNEAS